MKFRFTIALFIGFLFHFNVTAQDAGTTSDTFDVSLTGAASYSIPIVVPPGIKGVEPKISLKFSSQAENGLAGFGWNVGGISTITRIGAVKYYDGEIDPVDFDEKDRFALDGQRLLLKSGTYGANGAVYQTEDYSNIKIRSVQTSPYGPQYGPRYFVVHYPDGSRGFYGNTSNSRGRLEWALYKWQDSQGNFIRYTYSRTGELLRIANIYYGSQGSTASPNRVKFIYANRSRPEQSYIGGLSFTRSKILKRIEVYAENLLYRKYELTHKTSDLGYRIIEKIQESNGDNGTLPPINFQYGVTEEEINDIQIPTNTISYEIDSVNTKTLSGDFDGDGRLDVIFYDRQDRYKIQLYTDLHDAVNVADSGVERPVARIDHLFARTALDQYDKLMSKQGITVVSDSYTSGITSRVQFRTYSVNLNKTLTVESTKFWDAPVYRAESRCDNNFKAKTLKRFITGDFNGDAITDVFALTYPYTETFCNPSNDCDPNDPQPITSQSGSQPTSNALPPGYDCCQCTDYRRDQSSSYFINLDRRKTTDFANYSGLMQRAIKHTDPIFSADFNGDGVSELIHISLGRVEVYSLGENGLLNLIYSLEDDKIDRSQAILPGDYNGDGKLDFAVSIANNSSDWRFFISTGKVFTANTKNIGVQYKQSEYYPEAAYENLFIPQDFNGDGKTDILHHRIDATRPGEIILGGREELKLYVNKEPDSNHIPSFENTVTRTYPNTRKRWYGIPLFLEGNSANPNLEYAHISNQEISFWEFTKNHKEDSRLYKITNNGVEINITYSNTVAQPLSSVPVDAYYPDTEEIYPYINYNAARGLKVVSQVERRGSGIMQKQDFRYKGIVTHAEGLNLLGFKQLFRTNWYGDGVTQLWTSSKYDPQLRGALSQEWSANFFSNTPYNFISKTDYEYLTLEQSNKVFVNMPETIIIDDALKGFMTTKNFVYDANYSITKLTETNPDGSVITDYTYFNNLGSNNQNYHVGRLRNRKMTTTIGGNAFYEEEDLTYQNNLINTSKKRGQGTPWVTELYNHDTFGNVLSKTLSALGMIPRTSGYEYDTSGRYLEKSVDIEQLETTFTYESRTGNMLSKTDPFGRSVAYTYDSWNRPVTETDYLGKVTTTTYTNTPDGGFEQFVDFDRGSDNQQTFNAFGWKVESRSLALNNKWVVTRCTYDTAGRKTRQYEPYFSTESGSQYTSTVYDENGRPVTIILYTGEAQNVSYNGLISTVDDGTKTIITTMDAFGNIIERDDPGGTVTYTYHGNGEMRTADYAGVVIQTFIDGWGRKTRLIDPSAGTYEYAYNVFGELTQEITPKGTTDYVLDGAGKLEEKTIIGDETDMILNYEYNADRLLSSISSTDRANGRSYDYTYEYDSYRRPTVVTETNPFANFERRTTYDGYGRPLRETYKGQYNIDGTATDITVRNIYDNNSSMLEEIRNDADNTRLWRLNAHDSRGQVTRTVLGNGFRQNRNYDSYGLPQTVRDVRGSGSTQERALRLNYTFNAQRGILDSRRNIDLNWTEDFQYDQLDRLTTISGAVQKTKNYDNRGRITLNTDIGDYTYSEDKIYRLAGLGLNEDGGGYYQDRARREITYNAFKKPVNIYEENTGRVSFGYSPLMTRSHAWYGGLAEDIEQRRYQKHYSGISSMEIIQDKETGNTKILTYIGGDAYTSTVVHINQSSPPSSTSSIGYHYAHRDYLGSTMAITDASGAIVEQTQFGAWGSVDKHIRNGTEITFGQDSLLGRGYTGHEHYEEVGLVHMNGRMYDAQLGRFLSPDNFVQDPYNTQNFNRYGYVLNNPLSYSDPSGEEASALVAGLIAGAIIGAAVSAVVYTISASVTGTWNLGDFGISVLFGAVSGAISGFLSAAGSSLAASGGAFWQSATYGILSETVSQIGTNLAFGNNISLGTVAGSVVGGVVSGVLPKWNGVQGGYVANALGEVGTSTLKGSVSGAVSGSVGALVDGEDVGKGILTGARNGALGGFSQSVAMVATFGATYKPTNEQLKYANNMANAFNLSTRSVAWRKGGIYQGLMSLGYKREVTWGRNVATFGTTSAETFGHEYGHIIQFNQQGWAAFQGRGIIEQLQYTFYLMGLGGKDPYRTPGNNEWGADDYLRRFGN